jgi:hypothetical protein
MIVFITLTPGVMDFANGDPVSGKEASILHCHDAVAGEPQGKAPVDGLDIDLGEKYLA